ncbi:MAG: cupin-like domain-containing protein [Myxococcaceae bacterium]|nr:cupin-like domain-containing protein [Myxococcaceae bacterium]
MNRAQRLATEWRTWLAENLALGCRSSALLRVLRGAGVPAALAREELAAARAHPAVRAARSLAERRAGLESLLGLYERLHRQSATRTRIERRASLAPEEFFARYYFRNRPVVIEGLLDGSPALASWSPEHLAARLGEQYVEVMARRDSNPDHERQPDQHRTRMRLRDFTHQLRARGTTNDFYLTARNSLLERPAFRPLLQELRAPAGIIDPDITRPRSVQFWMGPAGTFTRFHHDQLNVLFCQLYGRKRIWLAPSFELGRLYNAHWVQSEVDARTPDLERYPTFAQASVAAVDLHPGDSLLIPVGWWHAVLALDVSLSVTFVHFNISKHNTLWRHCLMEEL